jgi:hypothetical protein
MAPRLVLAQQPRRLEAIQARHPHVHEHERELLVLQPVQGEWLQVALQGHQVSGLVIHQQDTGAWRVPCLHGSSQDAVSRTGRDTAGRDVMHRS